MDADTKDRIIEDMNPARGFRSELKRVINKSAEGEKDKQYNPSKKQIASIRSRITTHDNYKSYKFELHGNTYIRVDENNYKQVTESEDVLKTDSGDVFIRDENGQAHKRIKPSKLDGGDNEQ